MNDPHVEKLHYRMITTSIVRFERPPVLEDVTDDFEMSLQDGNVEFSMKKHFSFPEEARLATDPYLRAWELDVTLREGRKEISFEFASADIVDRNPPPPGSVNVIVAAGIASANAFGIATVIASRNAYPQPPQKLKFNVDVETMWRRYEGYLSGREPLQSMAYFCLTVLESRAGGRDGAIHQYRIDRMVLKKLGELTSTKGDAQSARKANETFSPLAQQEVKWIEAAIKAIIRRVGEIDADPNASWIKVEDLSKA